MFRRFSLNFAILSMGVDALIIIIVLYLATIIRPALSALPFVAQLGAGWFTPPVLYVIFPVGWVAIFTTFDLYDGKKYLRVVDEFTALSLASTLAAVTLAGVLYLSFREMSRAQYLLFVVLAYIGFAAWRAVARVTFRIRRSTNGAGSRRVLIIGTGPIAQMVDERLQSPDNQDLELIGFVDEHPADSFSGRLLGGMLQLRPMVEQHAISDVIVALPPHFYEQVRSVVACLDDAPVHIWIALGFFDLALYRTATEDFGGLPLLDLRASALDDYERMVKRAFDVAVGLIAFVLALPLFGIIALLVLLQDGSPIFFRQKRVGENGRAFDMLKFRSMVKNAEQLRHLVETRDEAGNLIHKTKDDPRVTPLGRFLRRYSLDELPQLINVLRGDMSLVGPRPELPDVVEKYQPWQRQRLAVPPGMTGWWQVTGRSDKVMHLHTEDDLYYVKNYSIWLDLQIIMRTAWVVLLGRGAY